MQVPSCCPVPRLRPVGPGPGTRIFQTARCPPGLGDLRSRRAGGLLPFSAKPSQRPAVTAVTLPVCNLSPGSGCPVPPCVPSTCHSPLAAPSPLPPAPFSGLLTTHSDVKAPAPRPGLPHTLSSTLGSTCPSHKAGPGRPLPPGNGHLQPLHPRTLRSELAGATLGRALDCTAQSPPSADSGSLFPEGVPYTAARSVQPHSPRSSSRSPSARRARLLPPPLGRALSRKSLGCRKCGKRLLHQTVVGPSKTAPRPPRVRWLQATPSWGFLPPPLTMHP